MRLLLHTAESSSRDLALEEAIHTLLEEGTSSNTWRLWQARQNTVVIGTGQEAAREVNLDAAKKDSIAVLRRHSGGGAVIIGPGMINFSAFYHFKDLPGSDTIRGAMLGALNPVIQLLDGWGVHACDAGLSDLAVMSKDGTLRKIAGNAQARKKKSVLVHGTLLANPDWQRLSGLLRYPSKAPDYRAGRDHRSFLTSLKDLQVHYDLDAFAAALVSILGSSVAIEREPSKEEMNRAQQLVEEKYGNETWNFRR